MGHLLCIVSFGEQICNLVSTQGGAFQRRPDFALALRTVAAGTFRFVGCRAVLSKGRLGDSETNDQSDCDGGINNFANLIIESSWIVK